MYINGLCGCSVQLKQPQENTVAKCDDGNCKQFSGIRDNLERQKVAQGHHKTCRVTKRAAQKAALFACFFTWGYADDCM